MSLWTAADAAAATNGVAQGDWQASGVSIDTRTLDPGDLFVALTDVRDGHDFVAQALNKGAAAAMVSHIPPGVPASAPLLIVDDVQSALEALGRAGRDRTDARVVAITGSVGKTSTKEMLALMLAPQGRTHASVASYNNHWGVPLTLARMPADTDYAVIEIGMNHPGEIAPLAQMARPHVAMITTVAAAHLEAFADISEIAREKAAIFDGLGADGVAVLNGDLDTTPILRSAAQSAAQQVLFGEGEGCDHRILALHAKPDALIVEAETPQGPLMFKFRGTGRHFALNALGALASVSALGADAALAAHALAQWSAVAGRGAREVISLDPVDTELTITLIDDAYNANPASVRAALDVLAETDTKGRRIAILGDMKELGPKGPDLHAELAALPAMARIDRVHCVGPLMGHLHAALPEHRQGQLCDTSAVLAPRVPADLRAGDVVLVKGSLSMAMARIVDAIRKIGHALPPDDE